MGTKLADAWNNSGQDERRLHLAVICRMFPDFIGRELAKVRPAESHGTDPGADNAPEPHICPHCGCAMEQGHGDDHAR